MASKAQVGGGDPRVVAHPSFRDIPECKMPLKTKQAKKEYKDLAMRLYQQGKLTVESHTRLSFYAMQFDAIASAAEEGRPQKGILFRQAEKALKALKLDELDGQIIAAPEGAQTNLFARSGFASRAG